MPPTQRRAINRSRCRFACNCPERVANGLDAVLALPLRCQRQASAPVELVTIEKGIIDKPLFTKDLQPVSYVFGDMAGKLDSPLYGLFDPQTARQRPSLPGTGSWREYWIKQPSDPSRLRHQVGR